MKIPKCNSTAYDSYPLWPHSHVWSFIFYKSSTEVLTMRVTCFIYLCNEAPVLANVTPKHKKLCYIKCETLNPFQNNYKVTVLQYK